MASLGSKIDTHDASIKSDITSSQNTITNAINAKGCVKSVQVVNSGNITGFDTFSFKISPVNMNKTILLTDTISSTHYRSFEAIAKLTSNTSISVQIGNSRYSTESDNSSSGIVSIQVIEFY